MPATKKAPAKKVATTKKTPVKKAARKRASPAKAVLKADVPAWSTIHIFGYGETQIIGKEHNGKVANAELKSLEPLFVALTEKQQKGTKVSIKDTHALHVLNGLFVAFNPKSDKNKSQRFAWSDVDTKPIDKLAKEMMGKIPMQKIKRMHEHIAVQKRPVLGKKNVKAVYKKSMAKSTKKTSNKK